MDKCCEHENKRLRFEVDALIAGMRAIAGRRAEMLPGGANNVAKLCLEVQQMAASYAVIASEDNYGVPTEAHAPSTKQPLPVRTWCSRCMRGDFEGRCTCHPPSTKQPPYPSGPYCDVCGWDGSHAPTCPVGVAQASQSDR